MVKTLSAVLDMAMDANDNELARRLFHILVPNPDICYRLGYAALYQAVRADHKSIVRAYLNPDISGIAVDQHRVLMGLCLTAGQNGHIDIIRLALDPDRPGIAVTEHRLKIALANATPYGHLDVVRLLLDPERPGIAVDIKGVNWALANAAKNGHIDIVKLFLHPERQGIAVDQVGVNWALVEARNPRIVAALMDALARLEAAGGAATG